MTELGSLIKKYRERAGLTQSEVAYKLGWTNPTLVSRIEQGVIKHPKRKTVDSLISAVDLKEAQKNQVLLAGGYLPEKKEIFKIVETIKQTADDWPYPSTIYDFSWRILYENKTTLELVYKNISDHKRVIEYNINVLDLIFNPDFNSQDNKFTNPQNNTYLKLIVQQFVAEQKNRTHQKWYKDLIGRLMRFDEFAQLYKEANATYDPRSVLGFMEEILVPISDKGVTLNFYSFNNPLVWDPRVVVEFYVPADDVTREYFHGTK
jgi:transcriptional regulator with XRE-family HTH domain